MLYLKLKNFLSGEVFQRSRSLQKAAKRLAMNWVVYPKNMCRVTKRYIVKLKRSHRGLIIPVKSFDAKSTKLLFLTRPPRGPVCEVEFTHVGLAQSLFTFLSVGSMGGHSTSP